MVLHAKALEVSKAVERSTADAEKGWHGFIRFTQHVPSFVDGVEPFSCSAASIDALLAHPRISCWRQARQSGELFSSFMVSDDDRPMLIAIFGGNKCWWVLGFLDRKVDLPVWSPPDEPVS